MDAILLNLTLQKRTSVNFFFKVSTLLPYNFAPYIKNLGMCSAILVCFDFGYVCSTLWKSSLPVKIVLNEKLPKLISISFVSFQRKLCSDFPLSYFIESVCHSYTLGCCTNPFNYNGEIFYLLNLLYLDEVTIAPKYTFWSIDSKRWMKEY